MPKLMKKAIRYRRMDGRTDTYYRKSFAFKNTLFRTEHPGLQNFIEFGQYYNNIDKGFECPVCKRNVCKKDRNTIYFTYHMQKCRGNLHPVVRLVNFYFIYLSRILFF